jgi:hypothetical protein
MPSQSEDGGHAGMQILPVGIRNKGKIRKAGKDSMEREAEMR